MKKYNLFSNLIRLILTIIVFLFQISVCSKAYAIETILNVAFDPNCPPYQFIEDGVVKGLHIDVLNKIAEMNDYTIQYVPINGTVKCLEALNEGEIDIVLGIINNSNSEYSSQFTDAISQTSLCMIAHEDNVKKINNKIYTKVNAVFENDTISYYDIYNSSELSYVIVNSQVEVLDALLSKTVNVSIGIKDSMLFQLRNLNLEDEYVIIRNYLNPIEYTMAVKHGDKVLMNNLNTSLKRIRINGEYESIYRKWINDINASQRINEITKKFIIGLIIGAIIVSIILLLNFRISRILKKQVDIKTKELQNINKNLKVQMKKSRELNELRNCVMENSPNAIIVFDRDFLITLFNKNAYMLSGMNIPKIGKSIFDIELFNKILKDKKEDIFVKGKKYLNQELTIENEDNDKVIYKYDIYRLFDSKESIRGALLNIADVTIENETREQIFEKEKNRTLNQLIAGIAHEIRNPLMSIKTFVELIPNKWQDKKFQYEFTKFVPTEVERVNNLIKNLIDYAKPGMNNKEDIVLNDIFNQLKTLMNPVFENENIKLNIATESNLIINADKNQITQILINIILNGYESIKEKMYNNPILDKQLNLNIKAHQNDKFIFIKIIDEGIGMTEDEIKKSTEPFFTNKTNGTGLGLSITEQFIKENEGTMQIKSKKNVSTIVTLKFRRK